MLIKRQYKLMNSILLEINKKFNWKKLTKHYLKYQISKHWLNLEIYQQNIVSKYMLISKKYIHYFTNFTIIYNYYY
jgi:hypothetical protein